MEENHVAAPEREKKAPIFSIVVPIYNVEEYLDRCVRSLTGQTFRDIEIILVDDGSPDGCPAMCDAYAEEDSRIKVIHKANGGLSDARNAGLRAASGDYVLFADSDDFLDTDACRQCLKAVEKGADVVTFDVMIRGGENADLSPRPCFRDGEAMDSREYVIRSIQNRCFYVTVWHYLYRRDFLIRNGLFFRVGYNHEDWDLVPRLFLKDFQIVYLRYPVYNYVGRDNSIMSSGVSPKRVHDSLSALTKWKEAFDRVEDRELSRYLHHEMIITYFWCCRSLKLSGWWLKGMDFFYCLMHESGLRGKLSVCKFEAQSVLNRLSGKWSRPDRELLAALDEPMK